MKKTAIALLTFILLIFYMFQGCTKNSPTSPVVNPTFTFTHSQPSVSPTLTATQSDPDTATPTVTPSEGVPPAETATITLTVTAFASPDETATNTPENPPTQTPSAQSTPTCTQTATIDISTPTSTATATCVVYGPEGLWHEISDTDPVVPAGKPAGSTPSLYWFGNPETGTFETFDCDGNPSGVSGALIIQNIAVPAGGMLSFTSYEDTENGSVPGPNFYDIRELHISVHGLNSWNRWEEFAGIEKEWYTASSDISYFAGQNIDLMFYFDPTDEVSNEYLGWMIDDISVFASTPTSTETPSETSTNTATATPSLTVTLTPTQTPTSTQTPTATVTLTGTITPTHTISPTVTITPLSIIYRNGVSPDASYNDTEDAHINTYYPSRTMGYCASAIAVNAGTHKYRTLIRFGLPGLPTTARIAGATLDLSVNGYYNYSTPPYTLYGYRVTVPWQQSNLCDVDVASNTYPTWTSSGFTAWATPGGDYAEVCGTLTGSGTGTLQMVLSPSLVQGWLDSAFPNYGIIIIADNSKQGGFGWLSNETTSSSARPRLTVYYYAP